MNMKCVIYCKITVRILQFLTLFVVYFLLNSLFTNIYTVVQTVVSFLYFCLVLAYLHTSHRDIINVISFFLLIIDIVLSFVFWSLRIIQFTDMGIILIILFCSIIFVSLFDSTCKYCGIYRTVEKLSRKKDFVLKWATIEDSINCPVCLCSSIGLYYQTNCQHTYCKSCLDVWLEKNTTCPVCRTVLYSCN